MLLKSLKLSSDTKQLPFEGWRPCGIRLDGNGVFCMSRTVFVILIVKPTGLFGEKTTDKV